MHNELIVNGEIVLSGDIMPHDWCYWPEDACFSARMVQDALAQFSGDVTVRVNSAGGDPFEGEAARAAFEGHPGRVTVVVAGRAASAASLMIMGAEVIQMTAGSHLMVHDPSCAVFGTSDELRSRADYLDTLSQTYAEVYAGRSGQAVDEVLAMMAATTWMGPQEAITAGFADEITGANAATMAAAPVEAELAAAMAAHTATISNLRMCADRASMPAETPSTVSTATGGQTTAMNAAILENENMPDENVTAPVEGGAATPVAPPPAVTDTTMSTAGETAMQAAERGAQAERARQSGIRDLAAPFMRDGSLSQAQIDVLINDGTSVEAAGSRLLATMADNQPVAPVTTSGAVPARARGGAQGNPSVETLIDAMMRDYSGAGAEFRGMGVRGLATHLSGTAMRGFSDAEAVRMGMSATTLMGGAHGVSDFAYITREVMNRTLVREYERRMANWSVVTGEPLRASDFREMHAVRFGGDFQLKKVKENGEYESATLQDNADGLKVERRGRVINLTFEAVVNDDMGALDRIPREFALAARVMEASMVWDIFASNPVLKSTGHALFSTQHRNLAGTGGNITVATVGAGRKAMWEQRAFGAAEDNKDFLSVSPTHLIVPPALETDAGKFVADTTPNKDADTNPWKDTLMPVTVPNLGAFAGGSDASWYLVSEDMPPISVARLGGYEAPMVTTMEGMNPDKLTMQARHIFGAAATEQRGAYKNP